MIIYDCSACCSVNFQRRLRELLRWLAMTNFWRKWKNFTHHLNLELSFLIVCGVQRIFSNVACVCFLNYHCRMQTKDKNQKQKVIDLAGVPFLTISCGL